VLFRSPYLTDPRFEIVLQNKRLFWAGNVNWLADQLREDYFCYWQHDDYCDPTYLEKLIDHAVRHPQASSVYCDMQLLGTMDTIVKQPSTTGFALQRVLWQIENFNPCVIRCLIRADAMRAALPIKLVFTWGMALARVGELHRVPEVLYFRNIRREGLTYTLRQRPAEELWRDSLDWALGVMENVYPLVVEQERPRLFAYVVDRLINQLIQRNWLYDFGHADRATRLRFVSEFLAETQSRFGWRPFPEMADGGDASAFLVAYRDRAGKIAGEELIIDAMLGSPP